MVGALRWVAGGGAPPPPPKKGERLKPMGPIARDYSPALAPATRTAARTQKTARRDMVGVGGGVSVVGFLGRVGEGVSRAREKGGGERRAPARARACKQTNPARARHANPTTGQALYRGTKVLAPGPRGEREREPERSGGSCGGLATPPREIGRCCASGALTRARARAEAQGKYSRCW